MQTPALVFSDQFLSFAVFDLQALRLALGIRQSLAYNPTQSLGLLPVPDVKSEGWKCPFSHNNSSALLDFPSQSFSEITNLCSLDVYDIHDSAILLYFANFFCFILHSLLQLIPLALPADLPLLPCLQLCRHTGEKKCIKCL